MVVNADPRVLRTREAVVDAVEVLLLSEGWDALTHQRVAEQSGVGRATLYRHWPTVNDLISFGVAELIHREHDGTSTGDLRTDLRLHLRRMRTEMAPDRMGSVMAALIARASHDPAFAALRADLAQRTTRPVRDLLAEGVERGELRGDVDLDDAVALIGGPVFFRRFVSPSEVTDELVDAVVDSFLAWAAPGPAARRAPVVTGSASARGSA